MASRKLKVLIGIGRLLFLWLFISIPGYGQFITTWKTDNPGSSADNEITIPTRFGETYAYDIYWEEVGVPTNNGTEPLGQTGNYTITFPSTGTYRVEISGTFPRIYFNAGGFFGDNSDYEKILTVEQWGTNGWTSMDRAFSGCENLRIAASDSPNLSSVTNLTHMFRDCFVLDDDISSWNVSTVTNMTGVFRKAITFNQPLDAWDVSAVTTMNELFRDARLFNQPLNNWNVNSVTNMNDLFSFAQDFNQSINNWNVSNVLDMGSMFGGASSFNQDISFKAGAGNNGGDAWNTANVTNMNQMFSVATSFNQDISNWNTGSLTNMTSIFSSASVFNQDISSWDISNVTNLSNVFRNAAAFNQDLSGWNVFISSITNMNSLFDGATAFNQDISGWDVSNVTNMGSMFADTPFNANISSWNVSNVTFFNGMFEGNTAFNQDISIWTINSVSAFIDMRGMFSGASSFNQNLGGWNVSGLDKAFNMLNGSGLSVENYDNLLIGWAGQPHKSGVSLGASGLSYCSGEIARTILITDSWFITDTGLGCIKVFAGADTSGKEILNGQPEVIDFGSINIAPGSKSLSFTIDNQVIAGMTNFNLAITNNTGAAFTLDPTPPLPATINFGSPLTLTITLSNLTIGTFTETVSLTADNFTNPFEFIVTGAVTALPEPEIVVFQGPDISGTPILDGDLTGYTIGEALRGTDVVNQITLLNNGSTPLTVTSLSVSGTAFSLSGSPPLPFTVPINGTQIVTITLDGTIADFFQETLIINNDDSDEGVFDFAITGVIFGPEIAVYNGPDRYSYPEIMDLQLAPMDFGVALQGTDIVLPITIANMGPVDLTITDISISGSTYSISATPPILFAGVVDAIVTTRTYNLTLSGATIGAFNEVITITTNDDTNSIFTFNLAGEILAPSVADPPHIYWTENIGNAGNDEIHRTDLNGNSFLRYYTGTADEIAGIAMDTANNRIYWTDAALARIRYGEIGAIGLSSGPTTLITFPVTSTNDLEDLALDLTNGFIYFTHGNAETGFINKIARINLDGTGFVELIDFGFDEEPFGIDIDHTNGKLYFTTNLRATDHDARLYRSNLDGTNLEELFYLSTPLFAGNYLRDVKIDPVNEIVYWSGGEVDQPNGTIYYNDINEAAPFAAPTTFTSPGEPRGIDLDLNANKIYWVCRGSGAGTSPPEIMRSNLDGSSTEVVFTVTLFPSSYPFGPPGSAFIALDPRSAVTACLNPPTANAGIDQTLCESDVATLSATSGGAVTPTTWTTSGDGSFDDDTSLTATYTPGTNDIAAGIATLTITTDDPDGSGPCTAATDDVIITISSAPTANAGADMSVCESDIVTLSGSIGGSASSALWTTSGDGSFDDNTSLTADYTPGANDLSTGTFTLTLSTDDPDGSGPCTFTTDDVLVSLEVEYTVDAGIDQLICPGDAAPLSGTTSDPGQLVLWSTAGDGSFDDDTSLTANYTPGTSDLSSGSTTLTLETTGAVFCNTSFDDVIVAINQPITVINQSASVDVAVPTTIDVTQGGTFNTGDNLTTTLLTQPSKGTATVNNDGSIDYIASANTVGADSFDFELCNQCGQCSSATIDISINNVPPTANIPSSAVIAGEVATIDVLAGITDNNGNLDLSSLRIVIQPGSGAVATLIANGILTVDYSGLNFVGTDVITLEICDVDGLCSQFIVTIEVAPPGVVVYNAVSPNGDSKHDFLEIEGVEFFPDNKIKIMNRWGEIIYETSGYDNVNNKFEGINSGGGELPSGTYYYIISLGDGSQDINGFFTLRR